MKGSLTLKINQPFYICSSCLYPTASSVVCFLIRGQMVSTYHLIKTPALHHWTECNTVTLFCIFTVFPLNSTFLYTLIMLFSFRSVLNLLPDIQPDLNMYISHILCSPPTVKGRATRHRDISDFLCKWALIYLPVMLLQSPGPISTPHRIHKIYVRRSIVWERSPRENGCVSVCVFIRGEELDTQQKAMSKAFLWTTISSCVLVKAISDP